MPAAQLSSFFAEFLRCPLPKDPRPWSVKRVELGQAAPSPERLYALA